MQDNEPIWTPQGPSTNLELNLPLFSHTKRLNLKREKWKKKKKFEKYKLEI